MREYVLALVLVVGAATRVLANEPPIQGGPADAACREQAGAEVFSAPNTNRLSLWDLGSEIWHSCMAAYHRRAPAPDRRERRF
ncbi:MULTISPECIES: hypothetical protein [Methylobacterium]|uniref:hypothetical protein n=1 Tax=Methylobacterium TaxID=407 RepID=UPI0013EA41EB|nr:hypothetical protein [Methylobacterium sp. DB0501]NGM38116.1 hypothetical protein [Methylobacterium sp. DB0501]